MEKSRKLEAEILGTAGARDNKVIPLNPLTANIICHLQLYFQRQLVQNNLKLKINIEYTKLRKARDNNQKSGS